MKKQTNENVGRGPTKSDRAAMKLLGRGARDHVSRAMDLLHGLIHCMDESETSDMWSCNGDDLTEFLGMWREGVEVGLRETRLALAQVDEHTAALIKLGDKS